MQIGELIYQKRKEYKMTQEQVAGKLGVSASAVHKWEKGQAFPDIMMLAPLARLFSMDVNTLLSFHENLEKQEIAQLVQQVVDTVTEKGFTEGFALAEEKIMEYPTCYQLISDLASSLQGLLVFMKEVEQEEKYMEKIFDWHKCVLESEDSQLQKQAGLMLFYHYLNAEDYARAEEILEKIPQGSDETDWAKATLYGRQGKKSEAKQLLERKLLAAAGNVQQALSMMQVIALEEQDLGRAEFLADTCSQAVKLLQLWGYGAYSTYLEIYCAKQDVEGCIRIFDGMFAEIEKAWKLSETTLYKDMPTKEEDVHLPDMMRANLIEVLLNEESLGFFRESEEGREYLEKF
ncbi:MAG: helix-turn-helix transcriptional regulator [Lachnospiraceae bacterium]|nr:helix-turn-helix transcriptional regulator [Lachnospiraceae bacterium]